MLKTEIEASARGQRVHTRLFGVCLGTHGCSRGSRPPDIPAVFFFFFTYPGWHISLKLCRLKWSLYIYLKKKKVSVIYLQASGWWSWLTLSLATHMPTLLHLQGPAGKMFTVRPNVLGLFPLRSAGGWINRRSAVGDQRSPQSCSILSLSPLIPHFHFFHTVIDDRLPPTCLSDWRHHVSTDIRRFFYISEMIFARRAQGKFDCH